MAISTTNLVPLDFETIKANLKTYLSNQTIFKDVDFEAANINVLLDVLAYNTFHNSYYLNMVASEMFLDTAQLQNSVASHAKILNYLPRSYRSAKAVVNLTIKPQNPSTIESILIPKGASFTGRAGSKVFTFTTDKNTVVLNNSNTFTASGIELFEGRYISEVFTFKTGGRYVISNPSVDTTSITVVVTEAGKTPVEYVLSESFLGIDATDQVYFLQPAENGQYEIVFGDNTFGRTPTGGSTIIVEYRISSGELPNTAAVFDSDGPLGGASDIVVDVVDAATGGSIAETLDDIRFRAPLTYSTQQRAVTTSDYATLIRNQFPDISDVGVFGGEELTPPRYGHVAIAMVSKDYDAVTDVRKQDVVSYLNTKCAVTITPLAIDPEFSYLQLTTGVSYDPTLTTKSSADVQLSVLTAVKNYASASVNGFDKTLHYSKLLAAIDGADDSIISNDTSVRIYRLLNPTASVDFETTVDFGNELYDSATIPASHQASDATTIYSTHFTYNGLRCRFEDDGAGKIVVITTVGSVHNTVNASAGTVDYSSGRVVLSPGIITAYEGDGIRLFVTTKTKDISAVRSTVLIIKDSDILITASSV